MNGRSKPIYEFGEYRLIPMERILSKDGIPAVLPPKAFDILVVLVENAGELVDNKHMLEVVWPDSFVEEANIHVQMSSIRKVLGENGKRHYIETVPKIGYRFIAEVTVSTNGSLSSSISNAESGNGSEKTDIEDTSDPYESDPNDTRRISPVLVSRKPGRFRIAAVAVLIGAALIGGYFLYRSLSTKGSRLPTLVRVPGTEQSSSTVISPNGEFFAHETKKDGKTALTMTNIGSNSSVQLLPFENVDYGGMNFSRDSSFLYFVKKVANVPVLFKIPILGHEPIKVLENVGFAFSFSPDGDRFCFVRKVSEDETAIVIANSDGTGERIVASRTAPRHFREGSVTWAPGGNLIAIAAEDIKGKGEVTLIGVDVETGVEQSLSDTKWYFCNGLKWMGDGTGLVAGLADTQGSPPQIWFIPYPTGEPRKITNDLNNYGSISVTHNGETIFAVQFTERSSLWVTQNGQPALSKPITDDKHHEFKWVRWTSEERLLFGSSVGGRRDVWAMNRDGSGQTQLTSDASQNVMPVATGDGRNLVFGSTRGGDGAYHLWRAKSDGREPQQLTFGIEELDPDVTPDGRWVFFTSGKLNGPLEDKSIWKVPINGGQPQRFVEGPAKAPDVSPDGRFLLCWYKSDEKTPWKATIFPIYGSQPVKTLNISSGTPIHWTMDGQGISYLVTVAGVSNIWTLPIDGSSARQETQFTTDDIFDFDWSSDGALVSSRISRPRDVVSIRNFR